MFRVGRVARSLQGLRGCRSSGTSTAAKGGNAAKSETYRSWYPWTQRENNYQWLLRRQAEYRESMRKGIPVDRHSLVTRKFMPFFVASAYVTFFGNFFVEQLWNTGILQRYEKRRRERKARQGL